MSNKSNSRRTAAIFALAVLLSGCATTPTTPPASVSPTQAAIALVPSYAVAGETAPAPDPQAEMARLGIRTMAYATIRDGQIAPTVVLGENSASAGAPLLFQAASISKPVAALGLLRLAQSRGLDLDADIASHLKGWQVDYGEHGGGPRVTLRGLLSHTAGLGVHGFPGYAPGAAMPDTRGVLDGKGNTEAVRVIRRPGEGYSYSGGGYTVAQLLVEELTGQSFAAYMEEAVLRPLGMRDSHFRDAPGGTPAPTSGPEGRALEAPYHVYPEKAAAALWTTPADLARFLVALDAILAGERPDILGPAMAREMLRVPGGAPEGYGLGLSVERAPGMELIGHNGSNFGYKSLMFLDTVSGNGIVAMTGGEGGFAFLDQLARGFAQEAGLMTLDQERIVEVAQDGAALDRLAGRWLVRFTPEEGLALTIAREGAYRLRVTETETGRSYNLYPVGPLRFAGPERRVMVDFQIDAAGRASGLVGGRVPMVRQD